MKTPNSLTEVKTNTHNPNLNTIPADPQVAKPLYERIFLGIDQHAADLRIVRQLDGAGTQPPQRIYPGADLERFIKRQLALAKKVFAVYEAGPCGFGLARQLKAWGVEVYVIRPMKLDLLGTGVNTDKTDAAELVSRLDRYLAGNRKAFAVVRVPTPEEEQRRCLSRQREQLRRQRQRLEAMGRSLMLAQGHRVLGPWWQPAIWMKLSARLPGWLVERLSVFRTVLLTVDEQLKALTRVVVAQVGPARPLGCGPLTLASATNGSVRLEPIPQSQAGGQSDRSVWRRQFQRPKPRGPLHHQTRQRPPPLFIDRTGLAHGPLPTPMQGGAEVETRSAPTRRPFPQTQAGYRRSGPSTGRGPVALANRPGHSRSTGLDHGLKPGPLTV